MAALGWVLWALHTEPRMLQYAVWLGMDIVRDADLLWCARLRQPRTRSSDADSRACTARRIAQLAVTAELPVGWAEHTDPMTGDSYCEP